jgi:hypothetical protein
MTFNPGCPSVKSAELARKLHAINRACGLSGEAETLEKLIAEERFGSMIFYHLLNWVGVVHDNLQVQFTKGEKS